MNCLKEGSHVKIIPCDGIVDELFGVTGVIKTVSTGQGLIRRRQPEEIDEVKYRSCDPRPDGIQHTSGLMVFDNPEGLPCRMLSVKEHEIALIEP